MRCLKCGYRLNDLPDNRCPECGRQFNPNDPETFFDLASQRKRRIGAMLVLAFLPVVFLNAYIVVFVFQWHINWPLPLAVLAVTWWTIPLVGLMFFFYFNPMFTPGRRRSSPIEHTEARSGETG